jgi:hypothetical protein
MRISCVVYLCLLLLLPAVTEAQGALNPPPKGYRLHRVRRLRPAPLPPGGLVPYDDYFEWGLSDTLGRVYVRTDFDQEPEATAGPFWLTEWHTMDGDNRRSHRWRDLHGDAEVWLNARGQYLVVRADYAAYRQPDGSLVARKYRRRLAHSLYRFEVSPHDDDTDDTVPSPRRYWRNWNGGWMYYLGSGLYAVPGSLARYNRRFRRHPLHASLDPPKAIFDSTSRRLTPYRYSRLGLLQDGRILFRLARPPFSSGYLDRHGREVLGPYGSVRPFVGGRAVVSSREAHYPHYLYGVIDTSGAYVLRPQPHELSAPDARGWIRRYTQLAERQVRVEYLRPDGTPAFPGRRFSGGSGFTGDSAAVTDTLGRTGVLHTDGRWRPRPAPVEPKIVPRPQPSVQATKNGRLRLIKANGQPANGETYAWAEPLAGNWFAVRQTVKSPVVLITPTGQPYQLPAGYEPDLHHHGANAYARVPFADGLLKVRWGKPFREGGEPSRTAYMTRSGRILTSDLSAD